MAGLTPGQRLKKQAEREGIQAYESKTYTPKKQTGKKAEKSASSLRSQGQKVEVVKDTGMGAAMKALLEQQRKSRAIRNEMNAVGKELRKSGAIDFASYQAAAQKQLELQKQLPSASFAAGLLESMGGDVARITAKASGNKTYQNQTNAMMALLEQTRDQNKGAGMVGSMTGELAKAGAGYATIGKAAEGVALAGAKKVLGGKALTKGGEIATRMIGQQVADTAVNTPITVAAGLADGKDKNEIAKDIGKQIAMDAAFNVGLEGAGAAARAAGKAFTKASKKGPILGVDFEKIKYDHAEPDEDLIAFKQGIDDGTVGKWQSYDLKPPTERAVKEISEKTGVDVSGFGTSIKPDELTHIESRHGANGEADRSMADLRDLGKIQYILDNYDNVNLTGELSSAYKNSDNTPAQMIIFDKRINGTYYVVEAVPDSKKKKLQIISAYKSKKNEGYQVSDAKMPPTDGRTALELPSTDTVADAAGNVKGAADADKVSDVVDAMMQNRGALAKRMTKEERQALELEYANLQNSEYRNRLVMKMAGENPGAADVMRAHRELDDRAREIQKSLAQQEGMRTIVDMRAEAGEDMRKLFGLTDESGYNAVSEILTPLLRQIESGTVDELATKRAFQKLFQLNHSDEAAAAAKEKLSAVLKRKSILLDVNAAADIADIHAMRKELKGKIGNIKIGRDSNMHDVYASLSKDFPEYFPDNIDDPALQMKQIRKAVNAIASGKGLTVQDYRENFDRILKRFADAHGIKVEFGNAVRESLDGFRSNLMGTEDYASATFTDVMGWHDELHKLQTAADKVTVELNKTEKNTLEGLLNGDITEDVVMGTPGINHAAIMEHYAAEKPLRDMQKKIDGHKNFVHNQKYEEVASAVGEIHVGEGQKNAWKDKAAGILYGRETLERNLQDIIPDQEQAQAVRRITSDRVHDSERQRMLMIRDFKKQIRKANISTKKNIKVFIPQMGQKKVSESFLVQWLGENEYELKKLISEGVPEAAYAQMKKEIDTVRNALTPEQAARINAGIDTLRNIYEDLHPMINEAMIKSGYDPIGYIEGYFPHMNFDDPTGGMEKAASMLGFDFVSKELPMDIAGRTDTFRPGKKWSGNTLKREGTKTDYDALRAFDLYIDNIGDIIYHTDNIQTLRNLEEYVRYTTSDEGIRKQVDDIRNSRDIPFLEKREKIDKLYEDKGEDHKLQNFVNYLRTYTDLLAGKKHRLDRGMETEFIGRKVYKFVNEIENKVAGNMVAGNIGSALTNLIPITQAIGSVGPKSGLRGMAEALANFANKGELDELTRKSAFLTTRDVPEMLYRTGFQKVAGVIGSPMEIADKFTTQAVWRGRYYDNIAKGLTEDRAIRDADTFARNLFAGRSKGAMPTIMMAKNPLLRPFTMFQLEVNNQLSYLTKDLPREHSDNMKRLLGTYAGIAIGAYVYNDIYEKLTGRRSALDPFGIANEAIGDMTGTEMRNSVDIARDILQGEGIDLTENVEKKNASQAAAGLMESLGGNLPFVGGALFGGGRIPIQSAIPSASATIGALADIHEGGETAEKGKQNLRKELAKPLWYLASPVGGGGQARKTWQGLRTMQKGGRYSQTKNGPEVQFAVDQDDTGEWVKSLLFGQWATEGGKAYIEDNSQKLGTKQTQTYEKLIAAGAKNTVAFNEISKIRSKENDAGKRQAIRSSLLNDDQKAILFYDLVASDKDKELMDYYSGRTSMPQVADALSRMAEYSGNDMAKRSVLRNSNLSESDKRYVYLNNVLGESSVKTETERLDAAKTVDIGIDSYFTIRNKYSQLKDQGGTVKNNWISWMRSEGYSGRQIYVMGEAFGWNMD